MAGSGCNAYQIRKIYAIGGALGMVKRNEEDDLLHELVEGMTGKKSIKALTYGEACKVIGELEGRQGTPPPRKSGKPLRKTAPGHTSEGTGHGCLPERPLRLDQLQGRQQAGRGFEGLRQDRAEEPG